MEQINTLICIAPSNTLFYKILQIVSKNINLCILLDIDNYFNYLNKNVVSMKLLLLLHPSLWHTANNNSWRRWKITTLQCRLCIWSICICSLTRCNDGRLHAVEGPLWSHVTWPTVAHQITNWLSGGRPTNRRPYFLSHAPTHIISYILSQCTTQSVYSEIPSQVISHTLIHLPPILCPP